MNRVFLLGCCTLLTCWTAQGQNTTRQNPLEPSGRFQRIVLNEQFHSEGAAIADLNRDGHIDIVSGPFWYEGPEFRTQHAYAEVKPYSIGQYSDHFFTFAHDLNADGWVDVISIPIPGRSAVWYQNPGTFKVDTHSSWTKRLMLTDVGNESPTFTNIIGDAVPELICIHGGKFGFARPHATDATAPWHFTPITDGENKNAFTHGMGIGDVDGDGRLDLLEKDGWWRQPEIEGQLFEFHSQPFAESGGCQMFVSDLDRDGDNDVVSVQNAHAHGLAWFERRGTNEDFLFVRHDILGEQPSDNEHGLSMTQMHALAMADVDGDGIQDLITGKRYWAHGGADPGSQELPALYWFQIIPDGSGPRFVPHLIDPRVGVGTQLVTGDVDQDGLVDLVVGNKLGTFLLLNQDSNVATKAGPTHPRSIVGTDEFKTAVRTTDPLPPEQEKSSFVLPAGFEAELVASEPLIAKPLNLAFDSTGRLWVSSSREYPFPAEEGKGRDTIQILEDTNGDGNYDQATTFVDDLNIPIGLYPYGDGVICYSIPNIWFLHDTDGDGKADQREVLYGPFDYSRDTHGMINSMRRGYDGWLYACHGFNNRSKVTGGDGHSIQMNSGNTFRMKLDGSRIEHYTHGQVNPFGLAFAPSGDLFSADCHTKPITLLMRNGQYEGFGRPHDGLGFVPNVMEHLHGSTAIAGLALYHDDQFPDVYRGNAFGGNVMTSRINRNSLHITGSTIQAREEPDFLISNDPWFRPVDLAVGPDGALYVADFYNRIIGHYEVPLQHPGRDRHRGRIWKIRFGDPSQRRDPISPARQRKPSQDLSVAFAIERLESPNLTTRMLATDELVDRWGEPSVANLRESLASDSSNTRIHALWALERLNSLDPSDLHLAVDDSDEFVRVHAMRIISERLDDTDTLSDWIDEGLSDTSPHVRRAAAMASCQHLDFDRIPKLLDLIAGTDQRDAHLIHALRMSLRDHLSQGDWFARMIHVVDKTTAPIVLDICPAIPTEASGNFLADQMIKNASIADEKRRDYFVHAARFASEDRLTVVAAQMQQRFASDLPQQLALLRSLRDGLAQRGIQSSDVVRLWAEELVGRLARGSGNAASSIWDAPSIGWTFHPSSTHPDQASPWSHSVRRRSSDGQQNSRLWSSFPAGESKTGTLRSNPFVLPDSFSFYVAGHDGFPNQPPLGENFVRVRDSKTFEILKLWPAPRNDTAQLAHWETKEHAGRSVQVELVDGIDLNAYAWLAVGRFSNERLNPSSIAEERIKVARLIAEFKLTAFRDDLRQSLLRFNEDRDVLRQEADAYVSFAPSALSSCLARCLSIRGSTQSQRVSLVQTIIDPNREPEKLLSDIAKVATSSEQRKMAESLASDSEGVELLIRLVESGQVSARTMLAPSVSPSLNRLASPSQTKRIQALRSGLPNTTPELEKEVLARKQSFLDHPGNVEQGKKLFTQHCGVCHQVQGLGNAVGPNLDGIGNRGLDRLLEDVLLPNRNIDAAFKASLLLDEDGRVVTGLVQRTEGAQLVVVDKQGKVLNIPRDSIVEQKVLNTSPMPANFHETLPQQETSHLMSYLLQLTR